MRKVNETLREILAEEVSRLKDPGLGFVTITAVDTSPDLRNATVYYSVLGDDDQFASTQAALERAAGRLRAVAGSQVRMKYTPQFGFRPDDALHAGLRMEELLRRIGGEDEEQRGSDDRDDPESG